MARHIPDTGWLIEVGTDELQDLEIETRPEIVAAYDAERVKRFITLEALEDPELLEVVATALIGDAEQACFRTSEARTALKAMQDHFGGGGS